MELSAFAGFDGLVLVVPLVVASVEVVKRSFPRLRSEVYPCLAMLVGLAVGAYLTLALGLNPWEEMAWGYVGGLAGTGTYQLGKRAGIWKPPPASRG